MNHDGFQDIAIMAAGQSPDGNVLRGGRTFVLYGGIANLAALDAADGTSNGRIELSSFDAPTADGTHGFVINGYEIPVAWEIGIGLVSAAGDVNGDGVDDLLMSSYHGRERAGGVRRIRAGLHGGQHLPGGLRAEQPAGRKRG